MLKISRKNLKIVDTIKSLDKSADAGKLTTKEEMKEGNVEWSVFKSYFTKYGVHFIGLYVLLNTIRSCFFIGENLWLADWSNDAKRIKVCDWLKIEN